MSLAKNIIKDTTVYMSLTDFFLRYVQAALNESDKSDETVEDDKFNEEVITQVIKDLQELPCVSFKFKTPKSIEDYSFENVEVVISPVEDDKGETKIKVYLNGHDISFYLVAITIDKLL